MMQVIRKPIAPAGSTTAGQLVKSVPGNLNGSK